MSIGPLFLVLMKLNPYLGLLS